MVGMDSGTPPVLFVVGTAGAGKSSLVTAFQRWSISQISIFEEFAEICAVVQRPAFFGKTFLGTHAILEMLRC